MEYNVSNAIEFENAMGKAIAGDTVIMGKGVYYLDKIYNFNNLTIKGASNNPYDVKIRPEKGRCFVCTGGSVIENISFDGGGSVIEAVGHGTTLRNIISEYAALPIKLSGDNHLFDGGAIIRAKRTGIEVNGGFYDDPAMHDKPIRLGQEIGAIVGGKALVPKYEWTPEQKQRLSELYYHRNMNVTVKNVIGFECGYGGGNYYGSFIKAVPCAGGIKLQNNIGIRNYNDLWNDFPSSTDFEISGNAIFSTVNNSIFVEGYVGETGECKIFDNFIHDTFTGIFVSAFPDAETWGNTIFFRSYGKRVHGLTGNRIEKTVGSNTPSGKASDKLISLLPNFYNGHQVAHTSANYDFSRDELYYTDGLEGDGAFSVNTPINTYGTRFEVSPSKWEGGVTIPSFVLGHPLLSGEMKAALPLAENIPDPTPDPIPTNDGDLVARVEVIEAKLLNAGNALIN